jgi:hypothetical protein
VINGRYLKKNFPSIEVDRWSQAPRLQVFDTEIAGVQEISRL